ncbi:uncharacterized protein LAESUDRAFT_728472 [Laetiporus sulphureus 93-53]|uniref:F-box domain-containing protein n=1 Tax=Laetiporus sulphureus 93-53 TaxID=1314785 RepID=A0A165D694_9APHY|nr:uncharacterized protein LAESUDRAFT_728472 [Laetiporus sulphureus 93-53]KZT04228.1 hypothetical protein LAESUDRAFT_728472 [Laetiporus sulphureus 93-53]
MSTILPLEIWDSIIDQLSAHRSALSACGLACRMWVARTRFHLFRSVEIRDGLRCDSLASVIELSPQVLTTLHPGISHYIRQVAICPSFDCYFPPLEEYFRELSAWLAHSLPSVLRKLDAMTDLSLANVDWTWPFIVENLYPAIVRISDRLETLCLYRGRFMSPRQLNNFLFVFPRLSSLVLEAVHFKSLDFYTAPNTDSATLMVNDGMAGIHSNFPPSHDMRHRQHRDSSARPLVDGHPAEPRLRRLDCSSSLPMPSMELGR